MKFAISILLIQATANLLTLLFRDRDIPGKLASLTWIFSSGYASYEILSLWGWK